MKKNIFAKVLAALLVVIMTLGMVACAPAGNDGTGGNTLPPLQTNPSGSDGQDEPELSYPLDTDHEITVWTSAMNLSATYKDFNESPFYSGLSEKTGVNLKWSKPVAGADVEQAWNLLLTDKVLPDIIIKHSNLGEVETLIADGVIYDLSEYLPVYAPDYYNYLVENDLLLSVTTSSGKIGGINQFVESDFNNTYIGPAIRKDWLDECGLDVPVTLEDWEEVLTAFKNKYGATMCVRWAYFKDHGFASGAGAYTTSTANRYIDDNGKIQLAPMQKEWKEYISILHDWYEKGLIDPDTFSADNDVVRAKALSGSTGVCFGPMSQLTNWINDAAAENTGAEWIGVSYPRTAEGEPVCWMNTVAEYKNTCTAMISTSCPVEEVITALRVLNYGFTEEGIMYWNFGEKDVSYTLDAEGNANWTSLITDDPDGQTEAVNKYTAMGGNGISVQLARLVQLKNVPQCTDAVYEWINNISAPKHAIPGSVAYTDEEFTEINDLWGVLETHIGENAMKFVTGDRSLDEYDQFVKELEQMDAGRFVELTQAAYDRYLSKIAE